MPLSILIGVSISNIALDVFKNYKTNIALWSLISLFISLYFVSFLFKEQGVLRYVFLSQIFIILNGIFISCFSLFKAKVHKAFFTMVNAYYLSFMIFYLLLF
ncbi:MAG: hypothetical protein BWY78_01361 [Alphaproteobacteria bacterium ADurb.Bin438]|nr:MAG: hypothetical protein BWY78_01361 [Alphaproteobacteria bacterium ADurb.Bin438]